MQIGVMTYVNCKYATIEEQIKAMSEVGINRTFINACCPNLEKTMQTFKKYGVACENFHSEIFTMVNGKRVTVDALSHEGEEGNEMLKTLLKNVLDCENCDVNLLVVHTSFENSSKANTSCLVKRITELYDFARQHNVTIAFENIAYFDNLKFVLDALPDAKFCWDTGHQYAYGDKKAVMPDFSDRLITLHVHDNNLEYDNHFIPFDGKIDFNLVAKTLADANFKGTILLEIMYDGETSLKDFYLKAKKSAQKVADMVENFKAV